VQFKRVVVGPAENPVPRDYAAEGATLRRIVDEIYSARKDLFAGRLNGFGDITPWVAWQLGIFAEVSASERRYKLATVAAMGSAKAAL